jgi:hypothetical protein
LQYWNGNFSEKKLRASQMRTLESFHIDPGHGDVFEDVISLSKNESALFLELIEMRAAQFGHDIFLLEAITK